MSRIKFKNSGKLAKDYTRLKNYENKIKSNLKPIGINLPLRRKSSLTESLFEMTYKIEDQVKVNLKNLILTRKGEYLCMPDFGTNLIDAYNSSEIDDIESFVMKDIQKVVSKYMPFLSLNEFTSKKIPETSSHAGYYEIQIGYTISELQHKNMLTLKILTSR